MKTWMFVACGLASMSCHGGELVQHRGIWLHPEQFKTAELVDQWITRIAQARLNVIYPLVWYHGGTAWYKSDLSPMDKDVPAGFDPLEHLITAAHARDIDVHAWFVNGSCGRTGPGSVLTQHPDWELKTGQAGAEGKWFDLGKQAVRDFERDVMLGCLKAYDLEGLHFDYIRYSDQAVCHCAECQGEFSKRYGFPPRRAERDTFPILLPLASNPLGKPTTARVLATFDSGVPAITVNALDAGQAVLMNWGVARSSCPAADKFARQTLAGFGATKANTYQLNTKQTAAKYRPEVQQGARDWLKKLGYPTKLIDEGALAGVPQGGTLILVGQYLMEADTADRIEKFVRAGGRCLFLDGPVFAIRHDALKRVTGMAGTAAFFSGTTIITPAAGQDIIKAGAPINADEEKRRAEKWVEFRKWTVSELVRSVYRGAKEIKPSAYVSAAVFYKKASADAVCQDWYGWLKEGCIDYVLPMAYTENQDELGKAFAEWKAADPAMKRIVPGLSIYSKSERGAVRRDLGLVGSQLQMCVANKTHGNLFFALKYLDDDLIAALANGSFARAAKPYYPAKASP